MKTMVDMFSGLGGASEAFYQSKNWVIWRYDNNPLLKEVPGSIISDHMFQFVVSGHEGKNIDLIWASPPCREFSGGWASPKSIHSRIKGEKEKYSPDITLLKQTIETINRVKPKTWVIENVVGSIKYFEPLLGKPRQIIGSVVLWGNFPLLPLSANFKELKKFKDPGSQNPLRSNYRAKIPFEISESLRDTLDYQKTLEEWI